MFARGQEIAKHHGLILVDTKYEFGRYKGQVMLMDEVHTPDSSRYFYAEGYAERFAAGEPQRQLSKEFVREWLMSNGFQDRRSSQVSFRQLQEDWLQIRSKEDLNFQYERQKTFHFRNDSNCR